MVPLKNNNQRLSATTANYGLHRLEHSLGKSGYSLPEVMIIIAIIGLISSIALPSSINLFNRERMRLALSELTSFIQNSRQSAMLHSTSCLISINRLGIISVSEAGDSETTNHCSPLNTNTSGNSINLRQISGDNTLRASLAPCTGSECILGFSYKGTSLSSQNQEILIDSDHINHHTRCLIITSPLGFVRTGFRSSLAESCNYTKKS